ncbi:hypothetical protein BGZ60DRAFT_413931 [Tricladium varicosporioides]|nr:hypothetical protein BGZ60DRAFT_413931 [Hymenoscyphus varicosporioides]
MAPSYPPVVRHITVNNPDGTSTFLDTPPPPTQDTGLSSRLTYLYSTPPTFSLTTSTDLTYHNAAPPAPSLRTFPATGASACVVVDIPPNPTGEQGVMHRTNTLDHVFILEGEMELSLDSGEKRVLRRGDIVVQRAPMHRWRNLSATEPARMIAVGLGGEGAVEGEVIVAENQ